MKRQAWLMTLLACACAAPAAAGPSVSIQRPSITLYSDPNCLVSKREAKAAELPRDLTVDKDDGACVTISGGDPKATFFVMKSALVKSAPCPVHAMVKPKATDMAGGLASASGSCQ